MESHEESTSDHIMRFPVHEKRISNSNTMKVVGVEDRLRSNTMAQAWTGGSRDRKFPVELQ